MFVGFIAVIVILLIIVGVMSLNMGSGSSNGVAQAEATNVITEVSALVQNIGFYKAGHSGKYTGLTTAKLRTEGYLPDNAVFVEVNTGDKSGVELDGDTVYNYKSEVDLPTGATNALLKSKAVDGVYYRFVATTDGSGFDVIIVSRLGSLTADKADPTFVVKNAALESRYSDITNVTLNDNTTNGAAILTYK